MMASMPRQDLNRNVIELTGIEIICVAAKYRLLPPQRT